MSWTQTLRPYQTDILREYEAWLLRGLPGPVFLCCPADNEMARALKQRVKNDFPERPIVLGEGGPSLLPVSYETALSCLDRDDAHAAWEALANVGAKQTAKIVVLDDPIEVIQIDASCKRGSVELQYQIDHAKLEALCAVLDTAEIVTLADDEQVEMARESLRTGVECLLEYLLQRRPSEAEVESVVERHRT